MDGELDYKESWVPRNWCFWTVGLEKTLESPLDCKEIQPVHPKGNQPWIFIGKADAEAETPILWPPDVKNWFLRKDPDVGKDWRQEEKGSTEDEKVGWHHQLNGREFEWTPGVGDGQGGLVCCSPWGCRVLDTSEGLNWIGVKMQGKLPFTQKHLPPTDAYKYIFHSSSHRYTNYIVSCLNFPCLYSTLFHTEPFNDNYFFFPL